MRHQVIVSFGKDRDFEYKLTDADMQGRNPDGARQWFAQEFDTLECDVANPMGKVLLVDLILSVAKYAGEKCFREERDWAENFARNAAVLLGRDLIRVDVANYTVGY